MERKFLTEHTFVMTVAEYEAKCAATKAATAAAETKTDVLRKAHIAMRMAFDATNPRHVRMFAQQAADHFARAAAMKF